MSSEQRNTIFDEEIATLEKRRASLEAERAKLLEGQVTVQGLDGNTIELDLGTLATEASSADSALIEQRLKQALVENPLVEELITSRKKKQELLEELSLAGQLPRTYTSRT